MRVAINGYGRIGRCVLRAAMERDDCAALEFVAINELAAPESLHYLTRYDSTHGRFPGTVELESGHLALSSGNRHVKPALLAEADPAALPWQQLQIDMVLECSGQVTTALQAQAHLDAGAGHVLLSNPGESGIPVIVCGVNLALLDTSPPLASAASCTSNALIPVLHVLHEAFGISNGVITTIHASMHDQPVIDAYHSDDLRKNRASSQSIIPVDTALALGIGRVLPELEGKFAAHAVRVPVNNVSALNITLNLNCLTDVTAVNGVLQQAAKTSLEGVMGFTQERLASCDFNHDARSGIIDAQQTLVSENTVNLLVWFDNEWAFANRMLDLLLRYPD